MTKKKSRKILDTRAQKWYNKDTKGKGIKTMMTVFYKNWAIGKADTYEEAEILAAELYGVYDPDELFVGEEEG